MAAYLRKPWIKTAVVAYSSGDPLPWKPPCQIIGFEDRDSESQLSQPSELLTWCQLSDKELWINAAFTPDAVKLFEADNSHGLTLYATTGGLINLIDYVVFSEAGDGMAGCSYAIVVNRFDFIGCVMLWVPNTRHNFGVPRRLMRVWPDQRGRRRTNPRRIRSVLCRMGFQQV